MSRITPCLWFDHDAEEAAAFYVSLLPDSRLGTVTRAPIDYPDGAAGAVLTVEFIVAGQPFVGLNGGPHFHFTEAVSFQIFCEDQSEVDRLWDALSADGGEPSACGWIKDRFGLSWQIVPSVLPRLLADPDRGKAARAMEAMMRMGKIDIAEIERAAAAA